MVPGAPRGHPCPSPASGGSRGRQSLVSLGCASIPMPASAPTAHGLLPGCPVSPSLLIRTPVTGLRSTLAQYDFILIFTSQPHLQRPCFQIRSYSQVPTQGQAGSPHRRCNDQDGQSVTHSPSLLQTQRDEPRMGSSGQRPSPRVMLPAGGRCKEGQEQDPVPGRAAPRRGGNEANTGS